MDIAREVLTRFISYDPETGSFTRIAAMDHRHAASVGKPTGSVNKASGYVEITVGRAKHYAHRLAWIYMFGAIPEGMRIDHRSRDRADNRIANLRTASHSENLRNSKVRADNTSGIKGVTFDRSRDKWAAAIGKRKLGRFETLLDAAAARRSAALQVFGQFANE